MVNKCVVYGCNSGYKTSKESISSFRFLLNNTELLAKWCRFVNRLDWTPSANSVICANHFEDKYIIVGKRKKLNWKLDPIPTIHSDSALLQPSYLYTPTTSRKSPKPRIYQKDQLDSFLTTDEIKSFDCRNEKHAPPGYSCHKTEQHILYYLLQFDDETAFPIVREAVKVDNNLHVQLQYCNNPVPLPQWFSQRRSAKLTNFLILENLPQYLRNFANEQKSLIAELQKRQYHRSKGQPPYSSEMIRFALLLRYTSFQAYKILLQNFPLPSLSLLAKLKSGIVNATKAAELLRQ